MTDDYSDALLITVPHGYCKPMWQINSGHRIGQHLCDNTADTAGELMYKSIIEKMPHVDVTIMINGTIRPLSDLNRKSSRKTCFRKAVKKWLSSKIIKYGENHVWLFDVHSFPAGVQSFGEIDSDIVILDPRPDIELMDTFSLSLFRVLHELTPVSVKLLKGGRNDIADYARYFNIAGVTLLEFNEQIPSNGLKMIVGLIIDWLDGWMELNDKITSSVDSIESDYLDGCEFCQKSNNQSEHCVKQG